MYWDPLRYIIKTEQTEEWKEQENVHK